MVDAAMLITPKNISAVILAGGQGRRMGIQNKGLMDLAGKPLIAHVIDRLTPQLEHIIISANADLKTYETFGYPIVTDPPPGQQGPLAGIYSALQHIQTPWLLTVPCDVPLLPLDYVARFAALPTDCYAAVAHDGTRQQSGCCLLHISLRESIAQQLAQSQFALRHLLSAHHAQQVDFSDQANTFVNINTPEQLQQVANDIRS